MTRRELLSLGSHLLTIIVGGRFLTGCQWSIVKKEPHPQLPDLIGYLLYDSNQPSQLREEVEGHMRRIFNSSREKQLELEILSAINYVNFKNLSHEDKRVVFKKLLPHLLQYPEILDILDCYLQDDRVLQYLDYPDLPGEFGECGWLVLEGAIWDRHYPPSGS